MANQRILATEGMVGYGHPTKADTLNRFGMVEHNEDGTHKYATSAEIIAGTEASKVVAPDQLSASGRVAQPGALQAWPTGTAPTGYLECDGSAISRTTYAALFAVIGDDYGAGDGSTTFNLPDFRGRFLRGWAHGQATDPDRATRTDRGDGTAGDYVGTKQTGSNAIHQHATYSGVVAAFAGVGWVTVAVGGNYNLYFNNVDDSASGGNEARPTNINVMICIKY